MATLTYFHPYVHAWHFPNTNQLYLSDFNDDYIEYWRCTSRNIGLAGGMVTHALDHYYSGGAISRQRHFPAVGSELRQELIVRQDRLFDENDIWMKFSGFASRPDKPKWWAPHTIGYESKKRWSDYIQPSLVNGIPVPLGIVYPGSSRHVVLAYGFEEDASTGLVKLFVYDPDHPDYFFTDPQDGSTKWGAFESYVYLEFNTENPANQIEAKFNFLTAERSARGFFHLEYPGEVRVGQINNLAIQSLTVQDPEAFTRGDETYRRERFSMAVSMDTNIVPYFDVRINDEVQGFRDRFTGEIMRPHACNSGLGYQTLDINYLRRTRPSGPYGHGNEWELRFHVLLLGQHDAAMVVVPASRIHSTLYLHTPQPYSAIFPSEGPQDVTQEDVVICHDYDEDLESEEYVAQLMDRVVYVWVSEESDHDYPPMVLVGWRIEHHLGYITKPVFCKLWLERMIEPSRIYIKQDEVQTDYDEIPSEDWEGYRLVSGYDQNDFEDDLVPIFHLQAIDSSSFGISDRIQLYARRLLAFVHPVYSQLYDWAEFETIAERIVEYIDRDLIEEWIENLSSDDVAWIKRNREDFLLAIGKECMRVLKEPLTNDVLAEDIHYNNELYLGIYKHQMDIVWKKGDTKKRDLAAETRTIEQRLLKQYNESIISVICRRLPTILADRGITEKILRKLSGTKKKQRDIDKKTRKG